MFFRGRLLMVYLLDREIAAPDAVEAAVVLAAGMSRALRIVI
jgi:hypothetical protein